jgi:hypothetical protein
VKQTKENLEEEKEKKYINIKHYKRKISIIYFSFINFAFIKKKKKKS